MPTERVTRGSRGGASKDTKSSSKSSDKNRTKPGDRTSSRKPTQDGAKPKSNRPQDKSSKPSDSSSKRSSSNVKPSSRSSRDDAKTKPTTQKADERRKKEKPGETSRIKDKPKDERDKSRSRTKPESVKDKLRSDKTKPKESRTKKDEHKSSSRADTSSSSRLSKGSDKGAKHDRSSKESSRKKLENRQPKSDPSTKDRSRSKDTSKSRSEKVNKDDRSKATSEKRARDKKSSKPEDERGSKKENVQTKEKETTLPLSGDAKVAVNNLANLESSVKEIETLEGNQTSLESGISMSSPHDMSGDEVEIEESISSRLVEVDEVEEEEDIMEDEGAASLPPGEQLSPPSSIPHFDPAYSSSSSQPILDSVPINEDNTPSLQPDSSVPSYTGPIDSTVPTESLTSFHQPSSSDFMKSNDEGTVLDALEVIPTTDENSAPVVEEAADDDYDDYEDDFEDYESDFEDDDEDESSEPETEDSSEETESSSEEESDLTDDDVPLENPSVAVVPGTSYKPIIKNSILSSKTGVANDDKPPRPKTSVTFINFQKAKKQQVNNKLASQRQSRGEVILSMIEMNEVDIELFTQEPIPYEAFIKCFGHSNRTQVSVQTNEDNLSEEVQTDDITLRNKWTMCPPYIGLCNNELPTPADYLGVGGDDMYEDGELEVPNTFSKDTVRLSKFLMSSTQVMLTLLGENIANTLTYQREDYYSEEFGFSRDVVPLGSNVQELLAGRPCTLLEFCPTDPLILISGHGFSSLQEEVDTREEVEEEEKEDDINMRDPSTCSLLCLWSIKDPSSPQHILACRSVPKTCTFSPGRPVMVVAGLEDGTLALWDLREQTSFHSFKVNINDNPWRLRTPSFTTACTNNSEGESAMIVSLHTLASSDSDDANYQQNTFQVVTLAQDGTLAWWSVLQIPTLREDNKEPFIAQDQGASWWSRVELIKSASFNVAQQLAKKREDGSDNQGDREQSRRAHREGRRSRHNLDVTDSDDINNNNELSDTIPCFDMKLSSIEINHLYVGTGKGSVVHCSRHCVKLDPVAYVSDIGTLSHIKSICICPHDGRYYLAGSSDGIVRLHCTSFSKPITSWQITSDLNPVVKIIWSTFRPCVFYILDVTGQLHIWDLTVGDIFPIQSLQGLMPGVLTNFSIASGKPSDSQKQYHACFANDSGEIHVTALSTKYISDNVESYEKELGRFNHYIELI